MKNPTFESEIYVIGFKHFKGTIDGRSYDSFKLFAGGEMQTKQLQDGISEKYGFEKVEYKINEEMFNKLKSLRPPFIGSKIIGLFEVESTEKGFNQTLVDIKLSTVKA